MSETVYTGEIDLGVCVAKVSWMYGCILPDFEIPDGVTVDLVTVAIHEKGTSGDLDLRVRIVGEDSDRTCVLRPEAVEPDHDHKPGDTFPGEVIRIEQNCDACAPCTRVHVHFNLGCATTSQWFEEPLNLDRALQDKVLVWGDGERFVLPRHGVTNPPDGYDYGSEYQTEHPLDIIDDIKEENVGVLIPTVPAPDVCRFAEPQMILFKRPGEKKAKPFRLVVPADRVPMYEVQERPASEHMSEARMMEQTDNEVRRIEEEIRATLTAQIHRVMPNPYCGHTQRNVGIVWREGIAHWECEACAREWTGEVLRGVGEHVGPFMVTADDSYYFKMRVPLGSKDGDQITITYD